MRRDKLTCPHVYREIIFLVLQSVLTKYYSGDQIEKIELGGVFSAYGGEERRIRGFGGET